MLLIGRVIAIFAKPSFVAEPTTAILLMLAAPIVPSHHDVVELVPIFICPRAWFARLLITAAFVTTCGIVVAELGQQILNTDPCGL